MVAGAVRGLIGVGVRLSGVQHKGRGMNDLDPPQKTDRKRGSGVKHVYDVLRDEIIDLV